MSPPAHPLSLGSTMPRFPSGLHCTTLVLPNTYLTLLTAAHGVVMMTGSNKTLALAAGVDGLAHTASTRATAEQGQVVGKKSVAFKLRTMYLRTIGVRRKESA